MTPRAPARAARACAVLGVALASITSPRAASAQSSADVETARAYFVEGTKLGNEGRWKEARDLYARSLQLKAAPITRYSLGVAQRETGRFTDALSSFRAFLAEPPAAATEPYVGPARAAVAALEASIGRAATAGPRAVQMADAPAPLDPPAQPGRTLPIVLMALGGAMFGAGLTVGLVGVTQASHAPTRDGADASAARAKGIAGDVMGTLGIATAGVGLVVLLVQGRSSPPKTGAASVSGLGVRF